MAQENDGQSVVQTNFPVYEEDKGHSLVKTRREFIDSKRRKFTVVCQCGVVFKSSSSFVGPSNAHATHLHEKIG